MKIKQKQVAAALAAVTQYLQEEEAASPDCFASRLYSTSTAPREPITAISPVGQA